MLLGTLQGFGHSKEPVYKTAISVIILALFIRIASLRRDLLNIPRGIFHSFIYQPGRGISKDLRSISNIATDYLPLLSSNGLRACIIN